MDFQLCKGSGLLIPTFLKGPLYLEVGGGSSNSHSMRSEHSTLRHLAEQGSEDAKGRRSAIISKQADCARQCPRG